MNNTHPKGLATFSMDRFFAIINKEFIQMRRDRLTFAMMVVIPIIQLILFGYAVNSNPKNLPTVVVTADNSIFTRSIIQSLKNTEYFDIKPEAVNEKEAARLLKTGKTQFVVTIPVDFTRNLLRNKHPALLIEADASDPSATGYALSVAESLNKTALNHDLDGSLHYLKPNPQPFEIRIHRNFNSEINSQLNIVPGLTGAVLTMTMIMMTGLAIARERERGTFELLLSTPVHPLEVMIGKIVPYIVVAYVQLTIILLVARLLFRVPMEGSLLLLLLMAFIFVIANLAVGILFSTLAKNQMQAMQMTFFFYLPSILLSGFMFAYRGMPVWAQELGNILPLTHFLRIIRGILLKGNTFTEILPDMFAQILFTLAVIFLGLKRFKRTLD